MGTLRTAYDLYRTYQTARPMLRALGVVGPPPGRSAATSVVLGAGLVTGGMLLGAGIALLVAPMSGRELRRTLAERASRVAARVRHEPGGDNGRSTWTGD